MKGFIQLDKPDDQQSNRSHIISNPAILGARRERDPGHRAAGRRRAEPRLRLPRPQGAGQVRVRGDRPLRRQLDLPHYVLQGG